MQTYDIIMAVVLIGAMIFGAVKGFAWQLASIASIVVSYAVAYHYREPFSQNIHAAPPWNRFLAMLILYIGTSLVIWVAFRIIGGTIDRMKLKEFDRQVGALFGLGKGAILCTLITLFAVTLFGDSTRDTIVGSHSGRWIARLLDQSDAIMPEELAPVVAPYLENFDAQFEPKSDAQSWFSEAPQPQPSTRFPAWSPEAPAAWPSQQTNELKSQATQQWQQATTPTPWQR
ncbi:membrane protein required for colicin V production [Neorhodopirellula lusitana]|uniref:Membrane protein required for colicin V production n=1 Tax=Neorhodopirellula lusitana TaxID=445327 RepID=A0ABY1PWL5_9BACT|nr:CvpA family protein [Neorhodopirellula lusitana]SMP51122.1 membrane protein required for colicin V production [Neorhodopirellula lusitana]